MNHPNTSPSPMESTPSSFSPKSLPASQIPLKKEEVSSPEQPLEVLSHLETNISIFKQNIEDPKEAKTVIEVPSVATTPTVIIQPSNSSDIHESKTILTGPPKKNAPVLPPKSNTFLRAPGSPPFFSKRPPAKQVSQHISVIYELFSKKFLRHSLDLGEKQGFETEIAQKKYTYLQDIADGGMGRVDLVKDNDLNRYVARKYILPQFQKQQDILERFAEEAQTTGQLEHPNIIPIHDLGIDVDGNLFFTMKFIKGKTLEDVLHEKRTATFSNEEFSLNRLLQIFQQIGHALSFAHAKGVIHRDLKPGNIMLGSFGEVIVMDWGLAKVLGRKETLPTETEKVETVRQAHGSKTMIGSVVGTPAYMPPEQALGEINRLDERSDIYSLGAILYELLTLQPPFGMKGDIRTVLTQVVNDPVLPPEKIVRDVPRELAAIALKALEKEKEDRYPTVSAMVKDVQRFLEGKEVSALPDSLWRKIRRKARHHAIALKWISISLVAFVVILTVFLSQHHQRQIQKFLNEGDSVAQETEAWWAKESKIERSIYDSANHYEQFAEHYRRVLEAYRKVLDVDFHHVEARKKLAEVSFKLWKIGLMQKNKQLLQSAQQEIKYYLGNQYAGSDFEKKMKGLQAVTIQTQAEVDVYLLRYEEKEGYLHPTPYRKEPPVLNSSGGKETLLDSAFKIELTPENFWGKTDLKGTLLLSQVSPGSYLVVLKKTGFLLLRVPLWIRHPEIHAKPPDPLIVEMIPDSKKVEGFTYVPPSRFLYGGTSSAGAGPQEWKSTDGFFIKTHEVTQGEYTEFLEHLCESGNDEVAETHIPRSFKWKLMEIHRDEEGRLQKTAKGTFLKYNSKLAPQALFSCTWDEAIAQELRELKVPKRLLEKFSEKNKKPLESPEIHTLNETAWAIHSKNIFLGVEYNPETSILNVFELRAWQAWKNWKKFPVSGISYSSTQAYLSWVSARDQRPYRLPKEAEWELAARGVDGRKYSWGEHFSPQFARLTQGYGGMSWSELGTIEQKVNKDESPFGVRDLAGSLAEWVEGFFDPSVVKTDSQNKEQEVLHVIRGNAWGLTPIGLECAFRTNGPQDYFHLTIGFRYCFTYQP